MTQVLAGGECKIKGTKVVNTKYANTEKACMHGT